MTTATQAGTIQTAVPARLDRLPWSQFHWRVVLGLGTVWILDGLEVTMVGSVASVLTEPDSGLNLTAGQVGLAAAIYVTGACLGALFFGQLTDRLGRKRLFLITLLVYILATVATAFAFAPWYFFLARFFTGAGIGGEYAAINSAIDELIPARVRGRADLVINGSYWLGAAGGALMALLFLNVFSDFLGWRLAFGVGAVLGIGILLVRRNVPESPRWLFIHGREDEAERIVDGIERGVVEETGETLPEPGSSITVRQRRTIPFRQIAEVAFKLYPRRSVLGIALFIGQAFIYNGVTFNLGLIFTTFYGVSSSFVPVFVAIWALGNFAGPVLLGRMFDTVGRVPMISGTYLGSAALIVPLVLLFIAGTLNEWWFLLLIVAVFFLASAGASSAYLTVSEVFPMETRALAIAFFYAVGTAAGGIAGPLLFGELIGTEQRGYVALAFLIGAGVMALGGVAELILGVRSERANLEEIAKPLTVQDAEAEAQEPSGEQAAAARQRSAQQYRQESARVRARSAEHRASAHDLRAGAMQRTDGDRSAEKPDGERPRAEEALAEIGELRALELDELATAHEELDAAGRADDQHEAAAARERAQAAEQRARSLSERIRAASADSETDAEEFAALAQAAAEQAQARQERAYAEQYRGTAEALHEHVAVAEESEQRRAEAADRERQAREAKQRIRERAARRQREERAGLRRFRPGPGPLLASPGRAGLGLPGSPDEDEALDREVEIIASALAERGDSDRQDLAQQVGARYWGPGRFRAALAVAVDEGRARRISRRVYGPPD